MFRKVLIANRGAIACRIIRTLKALGVQSVAVYSEADAQARHVREADEAYLLGPAPAAESYLKAERILQIAKDCGAEAIHPGYGFLSENPGFAEACEAAGIAFIGPAPDQMRAFGLKHTARNLAEQRGVPLLPGTGLLADAAQARAEALRIGYPVMLKSTAGGGGIGMRLVWSEDELSDAFASVQRLASANFKDAGLFLEKYVEQARHIEVQVFGDGAGTVLALGERDCSVQRRNQKVIEETPAPGLSDAQRTELHATAVRLAQAVNYRSAGTVEFVYDAATGQFYFLEVNTRLQVEHGVTEQVTGVDLVAWMVRLAAGDLPPLATLAPTPQGASIQVRLYAEDPAKNFQPSAGLLTEVVFPSDARVDGWVERGTEVPAWYDPMLAKLIVTAPDREQALAKLDAALAATRLAGIETNLGYLRQVVRDPVFRTGRQVTRFLNSFHFRPATVEVVEPGVQTSVQDWPGRLGHWDVGVPPSGPMDAYAHRMANRLVGNAADAAALEITLSGPVLRFNADAVIAVTGAPAPVMLDGAPLPLWQSHRVAAGSVLAIGRAEAGARLCLAVGGGFDVPLYLGSRSTFTLGQFGGHAGRHLRTGDVLHLAAPGAGTADVAASSDTVPAFNHHWDVGVLYGPHGAPDFFTPDDVATFFATDWEVHYNSSRTGVRLIGPKPQWARSDGGEAGLHPSNIHDNAYAIGAIDFTGDMPVILGPDGPSLGGFVCPAVVVDAELWKLGQLRPGDTVRFHRLSLDQALARSATVEAALTTLTQALPATPKDDATAHPTPVVHEDPAREDEAVPAMVVRQAGDRYLLVEFGPLVLDIELRLRVHVLMQALQARMAAGTLPGIVDMTPGIRSLQLHFDPSKVSRAELLKVLVEAEAALPAVDDMVVPSRVVHLPLSWDDPQTKLAIEKYMQSVRPDAPWCPSNIEFIRRINGLDSIDDVFKVVFDASYLVLGLGDVYLGAPVATPVDPRHRLVTTKYNPARTWTPENAVGIGGAYLCVYGMEGPGGYQFVGRTLQMWNRWRHGEPGSVFEQPWLLRFFDQIRFVPVEQDELLRIRAAFPHGGYALQVEETTFSLRDYRRFLADNAQSIGSFKAQQQAAFDAERERWAASGQLAYAGDADVAAADASVELDLPPGGRPLASSVPGSVWKVLVSEGQRVAAGDVLLVVESMKMEFSVLAPQDATVHRLMCREGAPVAAGQDVLVLVTEERTETPEHTMPLNLQDLSFDLASLRAAYAAGTPVRAVIAEAMRRCASDANHAFIHCLSDAEIEPYVAHLDGLDPASLPLYGVPFAIKDNIDLAHIPTTAGCPEYAYTPTQSAFLVQQLIAAGAVPLGKANLDQFATGLNGTRSPYGACQNAFNPEFVSGGSSSGSAVSVAKGWVSFSLGTDTAGSGRVPASFNNLIGLKPSLGLLSATGVVPACRSVDTVSIFALTASDAQAVLAVAAVPDEADAFSRAAKPFGVDFSAGPFRFGVPRPQDLNFFGNDAAIGLFAQSIERLHALGGTAVEIDLTPFLDAARLLYEGPWVAERYVAIQDFIEAQPEAVFPPVRTIIQGGKAKTAAEAFAASYRLKALKRVCDAVWQDVDCLLTPTAGTIYRIADMQADPIRLNSNLGYYTNFMNLLDYAAVAVPAGFQASGDAQGLPWGVTLAAPAFKDVPLLRLADRFHRAQALSLGATTATLTNTPAIGTELLKGTNTAGTVKVAVCGAHLSGLPLNWQLTQRGARLLGAVKSAAEYKFYALAGGPVQRPGMVRVKEGGAAIDMEVWELPAEHFGSFVDGIPAPLGIGKVKLADGTWVSGFVCEAIGVEGGTDITALGSWRAWLTQKG